MTFVPYRERLLGDPELFDVEHEVSYGPVDFTYEDRHTIEIMGITWIIRLRRTLEILFINVDTKHDPAKVKSFTHRTEVYCGFANDPSHLLMVDANGSDQKTYSNIPYGRRFPKMATLIGDRTIVFLDVLRIKIRANVIIKTERLHFHYPLPDYTSFSNEHDAVIIVDSVKFYVQKEYVDVWSSVLENLIEESNNELHLSDVKPDVKPDVFEMFLLHISPSRVDIPEMYQSEVKSLAERLDCPAVSSYVAQEIESKKTPE